MRGTIISSIAAFLMGTAVAGAQENSVYVNLSALDALDAETVAEPAAPLFPIVKPQPKKAAAPKARHVKAKKKAAPKPAAKVEVKVIEAAKPQPQPVPEVKAEPAPIPYVANADDVIVVDVEPVTAGKVAAPEAKSAAPAAVAEAKPADETELKKPLPAEPVVTPAPQPAPAQPQATVEPAPETPEPLLVNATDSRLSPASTKILFAEGKSELNDSQKAQIDAIVNSFANAAKNKIAIYSYNLDDGVDSFKKKRQSLNRAVEVRSYLLQKGYKNFSIKVLNVDGSSDKINSVELEELK